MMHPVCITLCGRARDLAEHKKVFQDLSCAHDQIETSNILIYIVIHHGSVLGSNVHMIASAWSASLASSM